MLGGKKYSENKKELLEVNCLIKIQNLKELKDKLENIS